MLKELSLTRKGRWRDPLTDGPLEESTTDTESRRVPAPGCREGSGEWLTGTEFVLKDKACSGDGWWCDDGCSTL